MINDHDITLSVCMIVCDEEPVLERCLKNAVQFADELIVVDTGSKDKTKEIAAKYTDKIFDYEWNDDFAAARNYSYGKATCDYIMWMDADDDIEPEGIEKLRDMKKSFPPETDVLMLYYTGDPDEQNVFEGGGLMRDRWIRRSLDAKWEYPIHEAIPMQKEWNIMYRTDIRIIHRKVQVNEEHRNIRIFERKLMEDFRMDTYNRAYYVRELATEKRYGEAVTEFELLWKEGKPRDIDYALIFYIEAMRKLQQQEELRERLCEYTERFLPYETVYCTLGDLYRREKRYDEAVKYYRMAAGLQIDPCDLRLHIPAYHDFLPWMGLAKVYLHTGDTAEAEDALCHAGRIRPSNVELKILGLNLEALKLSEKR